MRRGLVALVAVVALSACVEDTSGGPAAAPHPSDDGPPCVTAGSPSGPAGSGPALADLALPCFPSGGAVRLARLGRPVVINLWASWCDPCRQELPEFESYAKQATGGPLVVGVATGTGRPAARSIVDEFGLTFPNLYDPDMTLFRSVGRAALPVTLFVDAHGRLTHVYNGKALGRAAIQRLVAEHLGIG
jgi:thiol-disulfide isomerase/thioredoxin